MASIADVSQQQDEITGQNGTLVNAMPSVDAEIRAFHEQIDQARNLTDIGAMIERLKCWVVANPHYRERTYPIFEQLYRREEGAKEAVAEAEKMGLCAEEQEQRERLSQLRLCVRAEDKPEVFRTAYSEARQALEEWKSVHPADPLIALLNEHLAMEAEIASQLHTSS